MIRKRIIVKNCKQTTSYDIYIFFFKQKTAYEMRISDWSSDVCSSDLESARFAYAEINVPVIGASQNIPWTRRLSLTAAVRGEDYSSFGGVTTPKVGLI